MTLASGRVAPCPLRFVATAVVFLGLAFPAVSQQSPQRPPSDAVVPQQEKPVDATAVQDSSQNQKSHLPKKAKKKNDRMFYVMPNNLTVEDESLIEPISWKEKFSITAKNALDPYSFAGVGVLAGIRQADNAYPAFGQGMAGYGKRYGTALADAVDGNFMVGAVYPTILKTDPRYFQLGKGKIAHRVLYALTCIVITRKDSGGHVVNFSEFLGNATAIGISNLYYPASDRGFSPSFSNWGAQMTIDALGNEMKEFWPDIRRYLAKKKHPEVTPPS